MQDKTHRTSDPQQQQLQIHEDTIEPGQETTLKLDVGRLPTGTRIGINLFIYRAISHGPVALVIGGLHGDEINGMEIVRRAIESGLFKNLNKGSVIAIPLLNMYGFINFSREVGEGKDVNRNFPGNPKGSLAARIAHRITNDVIPNVDLIIDFHTGGSSRYNFPQIRYTKSDADSYALATRFAPRFIVEKSTIHGSFRWMARKSNIPMIVYEGGESLRLDGFAIDKGLQGLRQVLCDLDMKDLIINPQTIEPSVLVKRSAWQRASRAGIFIRTKSAGACVAKGEPIGMITSPYGSKTSPVLSRRDGFILAHNNVPIVSQGDALFHIAYEFTTLTKPLLPDSL